MLNFMPVVYVFVLIELQTIMKLAYRQKQKNVKISD